MGDEHYMEDEHEWPYLVWERKDDNRRTGNTRPVPLERDFKDIPFREFPSYVKRLILPSNHINNIINSVEVKPRDCTFSIHQNADGIRMAFTVKNEYLATEIIVAYDQSSCQFEYLGGYTYHDGLESMQWFKNAVRQIENEKGYKFEFCYNGHDFKCREGKLLINDDYETMVMFEDMDEEHYGYRVNFSNRKLEFYHQYPFHEYYVFFC